MTESHKVETRQVTIAIGTNIEEDVVTVEYDPPVTKIGYNREQLAVIIRSLTEALADLNKRQMAKLAARVLQAELDRRKAERGGV